jgi:hypothetical protein
VWSLAELNPAATGSPLTEGQRIIVPRHLVPTAGPNLATNSAANSASSDAGR